jgi:ribosomal protein S27E
MTPDLGTTTEPEGFKFCSDCGAEANPGASFCGDCGMSLRDPHQHFEEDPHVQTVIDSPQQRNEPVLGGSDEEVLLNLRRYNQHLNIKCLHCGYEGLMGVIRAQRPWWSKPWLIVAFILSGVGILLLIVLVLGGNQATVFEVQCPNCKRHLVYPAGAHLRGKQ